MTGAGDSDTCREDVDDGFAVAARRERRGVWEGRREARAQRRMAAAARRKGGKAVRRRIHRKKFVMDKKHLKQKQSLS
jgi:hypothetical protein